LGHGGEDGLAAERIWENQIVKIWVININTLYLFITCEFSRFDNPSRPTAGEYTYWNPKGGAIAMITTIREISQFNGENFNDRLNATLLSYDSNQYPQLQRLYELLKTTTQTLLPMSYFTLEIQLLS
jgi:hypothetical protein